MDGRTDRWKDGRMTDGWTDKASYRVACPQLRRKKKEKETKRKQKQHIHKHTQKVSKTLVSRGQATL